MAEDEKNEKEPEAQEATAPSGDEPADHSPEAGVEAAEGKGEEAADVEAAATSEATAAPGGDEPEGAVVKEREELAAKAEEAEAESDEPAAEADEPAAEAEAKPRRRGIRRRKADEPAEEAPAAPAPAPRRRDRATTGAPPVVRAHAKYVRSSARKARLVCDHIRGKSVEEARAILTHSNRAVARDWLKLLESAVANAEHNHELDGDDLRIHTVQADEGPTIKRFRPRAMGRATRIRKRTAHLTILLTPKD